MKQTRIFLLEDEINLQEMIQDFLIDEGFEVQTSDNFSEALNIIYENNFDLYVFDVKILGGNGFSLLKELRKNGDETPCIFTTSLNTSNDLEKGFLAGGDDYIKKPFELKELLLRIKNILKRQFFHTLDEKYFKLDEKLSFDIVQKRLFEGKKEIKLSNKESELLAIFLKRQNSIIQREELYSLLWDYDEEPSEQSLRVYIRNLRKILGKDRIKSHSKQGYEFV